MKRDSPAWRARPVIGAPIRVAEQRFTPRGRFLLLAMAAFALLGADTRRAQIFELFAIAFAVLLVASLVVGLSRPQLSLSGRLPSRLTAGQTLNVPMELRTLGTRPRHDVVVSWPKPMRTGPRPRAEPGDVFAAVRPNHPTRLSLPVTAEARGRFVTRGPTARLTDPLRLIAGAPVWIPGETIIVTPRFFHVEHLEVPLGRRYQPGGIPLSSSTGDSIEFVGTREYREGDPLRNIHWRSWARRGAPVVKEYQEEYFCRLALILDTFLPRSPTKNQLAAFEAGISVLASIADHFSRGEHVVDILAAGPDVYEVSAGRSLGYLDNVLDVLACIEPCHDPPFERLGPVLFERLARLSTVVAVLQDWDDDRRRFLRRMTAQGTAVRAFVVRQNETLQPLPTDTEGGEVSLLPPSRVEEALATGGSLRLDSTTPGRGAVLG